MLQDLGMLVIPLAMYDTESLDGEDSIEALKRDPERTLVTSLKASLTLLADLNRACATTETEFHLHPEGWSLDEPSPIARTLGILPPSHPFVDDGNGMTLSQQHKRQERAEMFAERVILQARQDNTGASEPVLIPRRIAAGETLFSFMHYHRGRGELKTAENHYVLFSGYAKGTLE